MLESYNVGLSSCDNVDCSGTIKTSNLCSAWKGTVTIAGQCGDSSLYYDDSDAGVQQGYTCCIARKACADWPNNHIVDANVKCPDDAQITSKTSSVQFLTPASKSSFRQP